ncbi:MAG: hypothetical protein ACFB4I_10980 [Cyanophyceae cyanobacterium]
MLLQNNWSFEQAVNLFPTQYICSSTGRNCNQAIAPQ